MDNGIEMSIKAWVEKLQSQGKYAFSIEQLHKELPEYSDAAAKSALKRLSTNGLIISVHKGYYLIIPPSYKSKGILPPSLYLDALMNKLERTYYLGLLSAAAYHGASHQQPQEFFVVTTFPVLRPTVKKGLRVNYISKNKIPVQLLDTKKTEAGYLKISNPVLTATDLVRYEKRVGGINRVATILSELSEAMKPESFDKILLKNVPVTTLQRLGYLLDVVFNDKILADALYGLLQQSNSSFFRIALKPSKSVRGFSSDNKWKVIVNTQIELDE